MDARYTVMTCSHITVTYVHRTGIHAYIISIFLSYGPPFILHVLLCHVIPVFLLHDYFSLLILIFLLLDTWAVDMRCVKSHIYYFPFRYLDLCYQQSSRPVTVIMYHVLYLLLIYYVFKYNNDNSGIGKTWRLIRLSGGCTGSIFIPLQGMVVLPTDCI